MACTNYPFQKFIDWLGGALGHVVTAQLRVVNTEIDPNNIYVADYHGLMQYVHSKYLHIHQPASKFLIATMYKQPLAKQAGWAQSEYNQQPQQRHLTIFLNGTDSPPPYPTPPQEVSICLDNVMLVNKSCPGSDPWGVAGDLTIGCADCTDVNCGTQVKNPNQYGIALGRGEIPVVKAVGASK